MSSVENGRQAEVQTEDLWTLKNWLHGHQKAILKPNLSEEEIQKNLNDPKNKDRKNLIATLQKMGRHFGVMMEANGLWGAYISVLAKKLSNHPDFKTNQALLQHLIQANKNRIQKNDPHLEEAEKKYEKYQEKQKFNNLVTTLQTSLSQDDLIKKVQGLANIKQDWLLWEKTTQAFWKLRDTLSKQKQNETDPQQQTKILEAIKLLDKALLNQNSYNETWTFEKSPTNLNNYLNSLKTNPWASKFQVLKNLQKLGADYFGSRVNASGLWSEETRGLLMALSQQSDFSAHKQFLENLIRTHGTDQSQLTHTQITNINKARDRFTNSRSQKLAASSEKIQPKSNLWSWISELSPQWPYSSAFPEKAKNSVAKANTANTEKKSEYTPVSWSEKMEQKTSIAESVRQISATQLDSSIPQDEYEATILKFITKLAPKLKEWESYKTLAKALLEQNGNSPEYEQLLKQRNASKEKAALLEWQRQSLQSEVEQQAKDIALNVIKSSLKDANIPIDQWTFVPDERGGYIRFQNAQNPNLEYFYRPSSGKISTRDFSTINSESKHVDVSWNHFHILFSIPTYQEMVSKASDPLWIPEKRVNDQNELRTHINNSLKSQINHTIGNLEQESIQQDVEFLKVKTNITQLAKKILKPEKSVFSPQEQQTYYQFFRQLGNSCQNLPLRDLYKLEEFMNILVMSGESSKKSEPNTADTEHLTDPHFQTKNPLSLFKLISSDSSIKEIQDKGSHQNMTDFGLWKLFAWLGKRMDGKDEHHTIFDIDKLTTLLNHKDNEELLKNPELKKQLKYDELRSDILKPYKQQAEQNERRKSQTEATLVYDRIQKMPNSEWWLPRSAYV